MINLDSSLSALPRIGMATAALFSRLGLNTTGDLLSYLPFRYDDFSQYHPIAKLKPGQTAQVSGTIDLIQNKRSFRHRLNITEALIRDDGGYLKVIWFNQPFLIKTLKVGDHLSLAGHVSEDYDQLKMISPEYEKINSQGKIIHTAGLIPNYHTTNKLSQKQIRRAVKEVIPLADKITDWLPDNIRQRLDLWPLSEALKQIHFPSSQEAALKARQRLAFTELFWRQLKSQTIKKSLDDAQAPIIPFSETATKTFVAGLKFKLTDDQRRASWEIIQDIGRSRPMSRLLEGDVGSGKTLVAIIALLNTALSGQQGALMAPTELLAEQHFHTLNHFLAIYDIKIALVSSRQQENNFSLSDKKNVFREADILVGTQALIQKNVNIPRLALAIVDEQHRFGVKQRQTIIKTAANSWPHFLSMTATPIPRSLALAIYGDLDLSLITEKPLGRRPIITSLIKNDFRPATYEFIRQKLAQGRQLFVICPLIDESDKSGSKSAKKEAENLKKNVFPEYEIGLLHGKMKKVDQEKTMSSFLSNEIQILVTTSIIEVGIDVPNATTMLIEGAERFGLAQLHQFRGRIGRSEHESYCFICPSQEEINNQKTLDRLEALTKYQDGQALAKIDLELRGAGDIYGTIQSGFNELQLGALFDHNLIKKARQEAAVLIDEDPNLEKHLLIKNKLTDWEIRLHLE